MVYETIYSDDGQTCYTPEEFVEKYNRCKSGNEAAESLGMSNNRIRGIVFRLRQIGYVLEKIPSGRPHLKLITGNKGQVYTIEEFVKEYNRYGRHIDAERAMGMSSLTLSRIAHRLRRRNYPVKFYPRIKGSRS